MEEPGTGYSTGFYIFIVLFIILGVILCIYLVSRATAVPPPPNGFKDGITVLIAPSGAPSEGNYLKIADQSIGGNLYPVLFNGRSTDSAAVWTLRQNVGATETTDQQIGRTKGFGNRLYLVNGFTNQILLSNSISNGTQAILSKPIANFLSSDLYFAPAFIPPEGTNAGNNLYTIQFDYEGDPGFANNRIGRLRPYMQNGTVVGSTINIYTLQSIPQSELTEFLFKIVVFHG